MSYPNPAPPASSAVGRYVAAGVAALVLAADAAGGVIAMKTIFRPATFAMTSSFASYQRVDMTQSPDLERHVATWAAEDDDKPTETGLYRMGRGDTAFLVSLAARPGYLWDPEARVHEGFMGWKTTITFTESLESREGSRSPFLLCATGKEGTTAVPAVFCAYADKGGYLVGVFDTVDLATAMVSFQEVREAITG